MISGVGCYEAFDAAADGVGESQLSGVSAFGPKIRGPQVWGLGFTVSGVGSRIHDFRRGV